MKRKVVSKRQQGFTLIELVVVIVILGILAATAVPKFIALDTEAKTAVLQGTAAALQSSAVQSSAKTQIAGTGNAPIATITGNIVPAAGVSTAGAACGTGTINYTAASISLSVTISTSFCS